jgi:hypothetical protein
VEYSIISVFLEFKCYINRTLMAYKSLIYLEITTKIALGTAAQAEVDDVARATSSETANRNATRDWTFS